MRKRLSIFQKFQKIGGALLILAAVGGLPARAQSAFDERIKTFDEVWRTINEKYYAADFNGVDWKAVGKKYRARVQKSSDESEFYALLDRMAGELRDSHTRVYSPAQRAARGQRQSASVGLVIREIEDLPVVYSVAPDSEAALMGVKPGMIVAAVNGRRIEEVLSETRQTIGVSSSERATRMRVYAKIARARRDAPLALELKNAAGENFKFNLTVRDVKTEPPFVARVFASGVAYLKFAQFDEATEKKIEKALADFKEARALIFDLRGNGGGDGDVGLRVAGHFFADKITVAKIVTRNGQPPLPEIPMTLETGGTNAFVFARPLVVLTDEATGSTAELIANALQEQKRARIFGTNSCGCVLAFLDYKKIHGGGDLTVSEFGFSTATGRKLEGAGVKPDEIHAPTLADLRSGRDAALEQAEEYLSKLP